MKKCIVIILVTGLLLLCACQPTPDEPVVVGKDQSGMIAQAKESFAPEMQRASLRERLNVPDRMTYSYKKGTLTIDADAEIVVPDGELPIVRVFPKEFDQETVTKFWNALIGDVPMQLVQDEMTKAEIAEEIEDMLAALEANEPQAFGFETNEQLERRIALYQQKYNAAPDDPEGTPTDGTLYTESEYGDDGKIAASHTCVKAESKEAGYRFTVSNSYDNDAPITKTLYDDIGREIGYSIRNVERKASFQFIKDKDPHAGCYIWDKELTVSDDIPAEAAHSLHTLPQNAWETAQTLLKDTGLSEEYLPQRMFLLTDVGSENVPREYAYRIVCTHVVNGAPALMIANLEDEGMLEKYASSWHFERFYIDVGDQGVYCVQFYAPLAVGETVAEQTNLMPFSEIQSIIEKMLPIIYETETGNYDDMTDFRVYEKHITRIELGLWRVRERDQIDSGLMIPVWALYADTIETDTADGYGWKEYKPILLINAVDGSIIDSAKGY